MQGHSKTDFKPEVELLSGEMLTHKLKLRFFDLEVDIRSDSVNFIDRFARMYRRFLKRESDVTARPPVECVLLTHSNSHRGKPVLIINGESWPLNDPELVEGYTYESIMSAVLTGVRSHILIHAGVVSLNGQGVIFAADTMHGKTTLVLELVRRGFQFLSDEIAALGRADRMVHPCPRSLWIRKGALERAGFSEMPFGAETWFGKLLLDIEQIRPESLGKAVSINHIIILQNPLATREMTQDIPVQEVSIFVDRMDNTIHEFLKYNKDISGFKVDTDRRYPLIRIRSPYANTALSEIEEHCRKQQILVLDVVKGVESYPTFKTPARLEPMPKSHALMELLRHFQGGYKSELLREEFKGDSARLFMELSAITGQARCYQLTVGPLKEVADLVCKAVGV